MEHLIYPLLLLMLVLRLMMIFVLMTRRALLTPQQRFEAYSRLLAHSQHTGNCGQITRESLRAALEVCGRDKRERTALAKAVAAHEEHEVPWEAVATFLAEEAQSVAETPYLAYFHGKYLQALLANYALKPCDQGTMPSARPASTCVPEASPAHPREG